MSDEVLARKECMAVLHIGMTSMDALLRRNNDPIPSLRIGRKILIPRRQLQEWIERQTIKEP